MSEKAVGVVAMAAWAAFFVWPSQTCCEPGCNLTRGGSCRILFINDGPVRQLILSVRVMKLPAKRPGRPKDEGLAARRCKEILDVAARLFAARGYQNTDVQVVADELGVGKGTVYRYFPSKRELFLGAVDRGMQRLTERIDANMTAPDPLDRIEQAIREYLSFFEANPEFVELLIQERAEFKNRLKPTYFEYRDANINKFAALHEGLVAAGRMRNIPLGTVDNVIGDLLYGTMFTNYFTGRRRSAAEQADEILGVVLVGLLTDAERAKRIGAAHGRVESEPGI